jgi:plastocyanin
MTRRGRGALRALVAAASLVGAGYAAATFVAAPGQAAGPVLNATVGPGFTISLTQNGAPVTTLAPGQYTVNVSDNSDIHNFHLSGPGGLSQATGIEFIGNVGWDVTFSAGTYNFVCDAHAYSMEGTFTVVSSTITTTSPTPPAITAAAVVQSVRVSATGRRGSRVVLVRIDLSKAAAVRVRLLRGSRTVASLRRAVGVQPKIFRLRVPKTAPGGRYTLEIVVMRSPKPQRVVRTVTLRP